MLERRLQSSVLSRFGLNLLQSIPVIPSSSLANAGEDTLHGADVWNEDPCDQKGSAKQELRTGAFEGKILREFPGQRSRRDSTLWVSMEE